MEACRAHSRTFSLLRYSMEAEGICQSVAQGHGPPASRPLSCRPPRSPCAESCIGGCPRAPGQNRWKRLDPEPLTPRRSKQRASGDAAWQHWSGWQGSAGSYQDAKQRSNGPNGERHSSCRSDAIRAGKRSGASLGSGSGGH